MVGPLAGRVLVRVAPAQHEVGAAVLQCEATTLGDDARAEARVVAVDERGAVAVPVGDREVDRVARVLRRRGLAVLERGRGAIRAEQLRALCQVLARD